MICPNCKDAGCKVESLRAAERSSFAYGQAVAYNMAARALNDALAACKARAATPDLSTRLDRIEAVLRAKGWM